MSESGEIRSGQVRALVCQVLGSALLEQLRGVGKRPSTLARSARPDIAMDAPNAPIVWIFRARLFRLTELALA